MAENYKRSKKESSESETKQQSQPTTRYATESADYRSYTVSSYDPCQEQRRREREEQLRKVLERKY